jgi:hypothetical protein
MCIRILARPSICQVPWELLQPPRHVIEGWLGLGATNGQWLVAGDLVRGRRFGLGAAPADGSGSWINLITATPYVSRSIALRPSSRSSGAAHLEQLFFAAETDSAGQGRAAEKAVCPQRPTEAVLPSGRMTMLLACHSPTGYEREKDRSLGTSLLQWRPRAARCRTALPSA